jgi:hypothetical protein
MAIVYFDQDALEFKGSKKDNSSHYTSQANSSKDGSKAGSGHDEGACGHSIRWEEKFRTKVLADDHNPIHSESFVFSAQRFDLIKIKVELYH